MKPLNDYDKKEILAEDVFVEIFEQEDAIRRAQMLLSFQDRAKELGVKGQFDTMVKAYEKVERETQKRQQQSQTLIENWTNFTGKYDTLNLDNTYDFPLEREAGGGPPQNDGAFSLSGPD